MCVFERNICYVFSIKWFSSFAKFRMILFDVNKNNSLSVNSNFGSKSKEMPDNNKTICTQYNNNEKLSENRIVMMNLQRIAEVLSIFELWQIKKCLTQG